MASGHPAPSEVRGQWTWRTKMRAPRPWGALLGRKIARRNALCTWDGDVEHIGHSDPADLFGGKTPDGAFWDAQIHATSANTDHL